MNELATTQQQKTGLFISESTKELIRSSIAPNTIEVYRKATERLKSWLDDKPLTDGLLAAYITELHQSGKYSLTIA